METHIWLWIFAAIWIAKSDFDCSAISAGTNEEANNLVINGKNVLKNGTVIFSENQDDLTIYTKTEKPGIFMYLFITFKPIDGVRISDFRHQIINSTYSVWKYHVKCLQDISYTFQASFSIFMFRCPSIVFNWNKTCGSGIPLPRKGFAMLMKKGMSKHLVVSNGAIVDKNFMNLEPGEKEPISQHKSNLKFIMRLLPVPLNPEKHNVTHTTNIGFLLEKYMEEFILRTQLLPIPILAYDPAIVYPSITGSGARSSILNVYSPREIDLEFNCLGVEKRTTLILQINIPLHEPVRLYIDKECSRETALDRLEETIIKEEEEYGFIKFFAFIGLFVFLCCFVVTICNRIQGKSWEESVPCCKSCFKTVSNKPDSKEKRPENEEVSENSEFNTEYGIAQF